MPAPEPPAALPPVPPVPPVPVSLSQTLIVPVARPARWHTAPPHGMSPCPLPYDPTPSVAARCGVGKIRAEFDPGISIKEIVRVSEARRPVYNPLTQVGAINSIRG